MKSRIAREVVLATQSPWRKPRIPTHPTATSILKKKTPGWADALMALRSSADQAERAADGFSTFRAPLPEHATEITGLISDFYAISSSLSSLDDLSKDPRYRRSWALVHPDVELLRSSLKYTIDDILEFFNRLDGGHASSDTYQRTWLSIERFFWNEAQYSLGTRLAKYKGFLRDLVDSVRE